MLAAFFISALLSSASDIPQQRLQRTIVRDTGQPVYYWQATEVGRSAQLLTLFCRWPGGKDQSTEGVPLVSVLRDTLGDRDHENDRVSYVWLLTYARPNFGQRILSAVPFFYWRITDGSKDVSVHDTAPLLDLTAPQHPVMSEIGRDVLQWTTLDPLTMPVRASTRAYRTNEIDHERLHLEEAMSYLRNAPVGNTDSVLTQMQLSTVLARLELRKRLLGGLVSEHCAAQLGREDSFEEERIRSRNWELLRQCAERTGLIFEPLDLAGNTGHYAVLWFPMGQTVGPSGTRLGAVWKLLNIQDPWNDARLKHWSRPQYDRWLDENGLLVPAGAQGVRQIRLVPLAVYSLQYPTSPLLLVDFRDKLRLRRHEVTQRTINEVTAGVIGISHFTNWYYYVAADLYNFVAARHGAAVSQSARLDCYSQFRVELALDHQLDADFRNEMQGRVESLAVNPLEGAPDREIQLAKLRYARLQAEAQDGKHLEERLDKQRRSELAEFGESAKARVSFSVLHDATLGLYTHRARKGDGNLASLDRARRLEYDLNFLDSLIEAGTPPEIAYDSSRVRAYVVELSSLMPGVRAQQMRVHVTEILERLQELSRDLGLQADCSIALAALKGNQPPMVRASIEQSITGVPSLSFVKRAPEPRK